MLDLTEYRLNNGLRVVLNEDHSAPLVAINLWYHVGSKNERPGRTGFAHLFEHMLNLAYDPDYSYHWPTIGSMEDLGAASLDDVRDFFTTWYRPDNATLTLVGDFVPSEARGLVQQYFGDIAPGGSFPKFDLERRPLDGERREVFHSPVQLPRIY